jgi:trans-2,3-dihydro-3-hydroxyanthranilate isomerase
MREFEDPVTGSASGCLGAYLTQHKVMKASGGIVEFVNNQGRHLKRPGQARVRVEVDSEGAPKLVQVGGIAVEVLTGEVTVP